MRESWWRQQSSSSARRLRHPRRSAPEAAIRTAVRCQRPDGRPLRGSLDADRPPAALVSRRLEEREAGADRLRAPVRAHDVQGLEERRARRAHIGHLAVGGQSNAYTTDDETVFWETVPAQYLPLALWLEADRMATLRIDKDTFVNEREVVKEERRMRVDNQPYGRLNEIIYDHAFTAHPYKHPTIGSMEDLEAASIDDVRDFYQTYYVPENATLVAGRRFRYGAGEAARRRSISAACRRPSAPVPRDIPKEPPQTTEHRVTVQAAVAAAGGGRRASHHLRRPSRLVSAAHRLEGAVGRPELAHLPEAGLRKAARGRRVRRRQPDRGSQSVLRGRDRAAGAHAGGGRRRADRGARSAEGRADHRARAAADARTSSRATTSSAASRTSRRRCSWRTPLVIHHDIKTADGEFDIFQNITAADVQRVARTYFTPENRLVLTLMPSGAADRRARR